jgi:hypothetical protein
MTVDTGPTQLLYEKLDYNTLSYKEIEEQLYKFIYGDSEEPQRIRTQKEIDAIIAESIRVFEGSMRPEMSGGALFGIGKKQTEEQVLTQAVDQLTDLIKASTVKGIYEGIIIDIKNNTEALKDKLPITETIKKLNNGAPIAELTTLFGKYNYDNGKNVLANLQDYYKEKVTIDDKKKSQLLKSLKDLLPKEYTILKELQADYNTKLQTLQSKIDELKQQGQVSKDEYNKTLEQLKQYLSKNEKPEPISPTLPPTSSFYAQKTLDAYQTANEKKLFYTFLYIAEHLWTKLLKVSDPDYDKTMKDLKTNLKTYLTEEDLKAIKEKALFKAATTEALKEKAEAYVITPFNKLNRNLERLIKSWVPYRFMYYTLYDQDPEQIESFKDKIYEYQATQKLESGSFDRMMLSMTQLLKLASINDEYKKAVVKDLEGILGYKIDTSSVEAGKKGGAGDGMTVVAYVKHLRVPLEEQPETEGDEVGDRKTPAQQLVINGAIEAIIKGLEVEKLSDNVTNLIKALTEYTRKEGETAQGELVNPIVGELVKMLKDTEGVVEEVIRGKEEELETLTGDEVYGQLPSQPSITQQPVWYNNPLTPAPSRPATAATFIQPTILLPTRDITQDISALTPTLLTQAYTSSINIKDLLTTDKLEQLGLEDMTDDQKRCYILAFFYATIQQDGNYFILDQSKYPLFITTLQELIKNNKFNQTGIQVLYDKIKIFLTKQKFKNIQDRIRITVGDFLKETSNIQLVINSLLGITTDTNPTLAHYITPYRGDTNKFINKYINNPPSKQGKTITPQQVINQLSLLFTLQPQATSGGSQNIITSSSNDNLTQMPGGAPNNPPPNPANPNTNPNPNPPPSSPQQEPILTPAKITEDVDLAKTYLKKSNQLQQVLSDVKSTWTSYVNVTPQKKFKDLKISILLDSLLSEAKKEGVDADIISYNDAKNKNIFNVIPFLIDINKDGINKNNIQYKVVNSNNAILYNFYNTKDVTSAQKKEFIDKRKKFVSQLEELGVALNNNITVFKDVEKTRANAEAVNNLAKDLKTFNFEEQPAEKGTPPPFFKEFEKQSDYYIVDIEKIKDFLKQLQTDYNRIEGYTLEEIKGTHAYLQKSAEPIKKDLVDKLTQVSTEYSKLIDELTKLSKRYATFNPSIKNRILLELEPKEGTVPKVAAIMENINTLIGKIKADIDTNKSNFEKAAEGMKTTKGGGYLLCDPAFLNQLGGAPEPDLRKDIDTLLTTTLKEPITIYETLTKTFINNLQKSSDPVFALTTQGNESLFNTLFNKYRESKTDTSKGEYVAAMELAEGLEANNLLPREVLKINYFDKTVFIFASLFIRLLALTLVDLLIDNDKLQKLSYTFLSYVGIYIGIFYVFLIIVNLDDYKLRVIFNYVNMHANASVAVMHPAIVAVFGAIIYYVMLNINKGEGYTVATDEDRVRLKYKIQVLSLVIWMFTSLLVLLI